MSKLRKHDYTIDGSNWDLSLLSLNDVPVPELKKNPKARKVDLSQNFFTLLPDSFTSLTYLVELDLSKNRLERLPDDFGNLNKLVKLDLYSNKLRTLPLTFGQLTKLRWLDLKNNPLEQALARKAGDCSNQRQCQICAKNCVDFMKAEKSRMETEKKAFEERLKVKQEYERRLLEKNQKEKERKKAKKVRSTARKAQQKQDEQNDNEDDDEEEEESSKESDNNQRKPKRSFFGSVFAFIWFLVRSLLFVSMVLGSIFIGISIGLRLQSGHKLESLEDIKTAFRHTLRRLENIEQFKKDLVLLIDTIVRNLKNLWKTSLNSFAKQENVTKV